MSFLAVASNKRGFEAICRLNGISCIKGVRRFLQRPRDYDAIRVPSESNDRDKDISSEVCLLKGSFYA
jgi:hypothetical protein